MVEPVQIRERNRGEHAFDGDEGDLSAGEAAGFEGDFVELVGVFDGRDEEAGDAAAAEEDEAREKSKVMAHEYDVLERH